MTARSKTNQPSPLVAALKAAQEHEAEVHQAIENLTAEVNDLQAEHDALAAQIEQGSVVADFDRATELEETIIPRKSRRLADLTERVLPSVEQTRVGAELALAATEGIDSLVAKDQAYRARRRELETVISEAVAELRQVTTERDRLVSSLAGKAFRAGLTDHQGDPLSRVRATTATSLRSSDYNHRDATGAVLVDGTEYAPIGAQSAVQLAVGKADQVIATAVAEKEHSEWIKSARPAGAVAPQNRRHR